MQRIEYQIHGMVQGIGFRPAVFCLAKKLQLTGWVANNGSGVTLQLQGLLVRDFIQQLKNMLPTFTTMQIVATRLIPIITGESDFQIKPSLSTNQKADFIPDLAICDQCLMELFDPNSRFYLYPLINCSQCGPRYSITRELPYDRLQTSMQSFVMCPACAEDYNDPINRRFHAEPIACNACGPNYDISLTSAAQLLKENQIIAIKALGGYQLIANAFSLKLIQQLRVNKHRPYKPFAIMFPNLNSVREYYYCDSIEEQQLLSPARPIVLLKIKKEFNHWIAPSLTEHGVMLPHTAMHYLLFYYYLNQPNDCQRNHSVFPHAFVVTSANLAGQNLITDIKHINESFKKITPHIISHNRAILTGVDDSIIKIIANKPAIIRRARGFAPIKINCNNLAEGILALGCHLKNTVCLTKNNAAYVSQYLGTLQHKNTIEFMHKTIHHLQKLFEIEIKYITHDLHPDIYTTQFANSLNLPSIAVQHHHAHIASVMAEYQLNEPVLGWVLDGFGYYSAAESWGGELLYVNGAEFKQMLQLQSYIALGGDQIATEPWRIALSILISLKQHRAIENLVGEDTTRHQVRKALEISNHKIKTSSCGRYFDAASALLNICQHNTYEAEAALKLEALVTQPLVLANGWELKNNKLDFSNLWQFLLTVDPVTGANYFHGTLANALAESAREVCNSLGINKFILTGGCLQNKILAELIIVQLEKYNLDVYYPRHLPCNDGGLSLGQAWIASNTFH